MYVNVYGLFYGKVDACANGVYQALSPPLLKGPRDEARPLTTSSFARSHTCTPTQSSRGGGGGGGGEARFINLQFSSIAIKNQRRFLGTIQTPEDD